MYILFYLYITNNNFKYISNNQNVAKLFRYIFCYEKEEIISIFFIFVYITWRQMKNISCFPDQECYELDKQTQNSTDLDLGNPELGNETR